MLVLRPVNQSDLDFVYQLACQSGAMVYTLPSDKSLLREKIDHSIWSFAQQVVSPGEERYLFVLENSATNERVGVAGIHALAGHKQPFYSFRNETLFHSSPSLGVHSRIHALTLTHDLSDHSQLVSFCLAKEVEHRVSPILLTLGRLLFMAAQPNRFSEHWMAVICGLCDQGDSPFWQDVGRRFFQMDYEAVELLNGPQGSSYIAQLMPHYPIYVPLLSQKAQAAIGQVNDSTHLQHQLLSDQGFRSNKYVEIFDAGPIVTAQANSLAIWQFCFKAQIELGDVLIGAKKYLLGFEHVNGFSTAMVHADVSGDRCVIDRETMAQLGLALAQKVTLFAL
ncbi:MULTISPECIES: arginine N-succinyltransferase [unclassified Vibrio]|uniref:Arginine N-succinyltransferase n=1 Tax=Vibrio sp. HB236076 TaxID=3232307 RepID=A0AB39HGE3_9VIBR|nr:arginine N-succinyltransferase [Vibrio sp. HB161653]MDP5252673.1 arginine N-succinyltransferase [Vibrio sp. HB161653]